MVVVVDARHEIVVGGSLPPKRIDIAILLAACAQIGIHYHIYGVGLRPILLVLEVGLLTEVIEIITLRMVGKTCSPEIGD